MIPWVAQSSKLILKVLAAKILEHEKGRDLTLWPQAIVLRTYNGIMTFYSYRWFSKYHQEKSTRQIPFIFGPVVYKWMNSLFLNFWVSGIYYYFFMQFWILQIRQNQQYRTYLAHKHKIQKWIAISELFCLMKAGKC